MNASPLSADQRDALQEVANIAMGQAGATLASVLGTVVRLSIPRIDIIAVADVNTAITKMVGHHGLITAVRQSFLGSLRGEAVVLYGEQNWKDLADLMGYDEALDSATEKELLLDIANALVGACLCGMAALLTTRLTFSAPSLMAEKVEADQLMTPEKLRWGQVLLVEINFGLESRGFTSHVIMFMPDESIDIMRHSLDKFMESYR